MASSTPSMSCLESRRGGFPLAPELGLLNRPSQRLLLRLRFARIFKSSLRRHPTLCLGPPSQRPTLPAYSKSPSASLRLSIRFGKCLLQLLAEGALMLCRYLQHEMQSQSIDISWPSRREFCHRSRHAESRQSRFYRRGLPDAGRPLYHRTATGRAKA